MCGSDVTISGWVCCLGGGLNFSPNLRLTVFIEVVLRKKMRLLGKPSQYASLAHITVACSISESYRITFIVYNRINCLYEILCSHI